MRALSLAALLAFLLPAAPAAAGGYAFSGVVTSYCQSGTMADGDFTYAGAAAGAAWLPFGSRLWVSGVGPVTIEDRGVPGLFTVDVFVWRCAYARELGRQWRRIWVLRWGWGGG
jgi:3D (Asp-Asp-Asp) domain-containing protein